MLKAVAKKILPPQTRRGKAAKSLAAVFGFAKPYQYEFEYQRWIQYIEPEEFLPIVKRKKEEQPLFSIVIPFFNTADKYLYPLLDSITGQSFDDWELIVADASTDKKRSTAIRKAIEYDERLHYHRISKNEGISGNTNQAIKHATGKYVVFCDHDDTLSPHALNEVAAKIIDNSSVDIIYSDEDKLTDNGKLRHSPFFKPDWSPHLFFNTNYTNHLSVVKRELIERVGGLRSAFDGSQDYDLLLRIHRLSEKPIQVEHIDKVLYHWREADGSTAINHNSKSYAFEAGRKALQEYIDSGNVTGKVENIRNRPGFYLHKLSPNQLHKAVVYVGVSENMKVNQVVADRLRSLHKSEIVTAEFIAVKKSLIDDVLIEKDTSTATFKFRSVVYPRETDWLERLTAVLELPDVKCVAPRILSADGGEIVDMGVVYDASGQATELFKGLASDDQTLVGHVEWVRDVDDLSGALIGYPPKLSEDRKYNVIWSYVLFCHIPVLSHSTFLNGNLRLKTGKKSQIRIRVNG